MSEGDPAAVAVVVALVLDALHVPYLVGGSLASTVHGMVRTTVDADLVADMTSGHVEPFAQALEGSFYLDRDAIRDAVHRRSCFNIIHLGSMVKVDVYLKKDRAFDDEQFRRRARQIIGAEGGAAELASAEDTVLAKLEWYRLGGEVSERQWRDVLGVVKTQRERLDRPYLRRWATTLALSDLLERALSEE